MPYLIFLGCFLIYLRLMAPAIALEDSGEFATAAVTLSLTHPPGYPFYIFTGKVFSVLPVGSPGFRLSILSATGASLAASFIYTFTRELCAGRHSAAVLAALSLAFAPALALQGVIADKYAVNLALVTGAMLLALRIWRIPGSSLAPATFLTGVALAHHMQILYLGPVIAALFWRERHRIITSRGIILLGLILLPFSLKPIAIPLLSRATPSLMFGQVDTARKLERYLSARDYSGRFAAYSTPEKLSRFWTHGIAEIGRQAGIPVLALALAGAIALVRARSGAVLLAGGACSAIALVLVSWFNIAGVDYYLLPVVAFVCALAGTGMESLGARLGRTLALCAAVLAVTSAALRGLPGANLSGYYGSVDWGRSLLRSMKPGAVLVTRHDDDFYPPMYLQRVLEERNDVALIHRPFLTRLWHHDQAERIYPGFVALDPALIPWGKTVEPEGFINLFLRSHHGKRDVGFTYLATSETAGGFLLRPEGWVFKLGRQPGEPPLPQPEEYWRTFSRFSFRMTFGPFPAGTRFREVAGAPATLWVQLALRWWDRGERDLARSCLRRGLAFPYTRVVEEDLVRVSSLMGVR